MHMNNKTWFANYLTSRQAQVMNIDSNSSYRYLPNEPLQGSVLSPLSYNLPRPSPSPNIPVLTHAADLAIASKHSIFQKATSNLQNYLATLEKWLTQNHMLAPPSKSTITLLTPDRQESQVHPHVTCFNQPLPMERQPKILALTLDPHITFTQHVDKVNTKATCKLNPLKALPSTTFRLQKESQNTCTYNS